MKTVYRLSYKLGKFSNKLSIKPIWKVYDAFKQGRKDSLSDIV